MTKKNKEIMNKETTVNEESAINELNQVEKQVQYLQSQLQQAAQLLNQKDQQLSGLKIRVFDAEEQIKSNEHHIQHFLNEVGSLLGKQVTLQAVYDFIFSIVNKESQPDTFTPTGENEVTIKD